MVSVRIDCQSYVVRTVIKTVYQGEEKEQDEGRFSRKIKIWIWKAHFWQAEDTVIPCMHAV